MTDELLTVKPNKEWKQVPYHKEKTFESVIDFLYNEENCSSLSITKETHKAIYLSHPDNLRFAGNMEQTENGETYRFQVWDLLTVFGVVRVRITGRRVLQSKSKLWTPTETN